MSELRYDAVRQACAAAGVPLRDRYGYPIPDEWLLDAVLVVRGAASLAEAGDALEQAVLLGRFELAAATSLCFPINAAEAHALAVILRSPLAKTAVTR